MCCSYMVPTDIVFMTKSGYPADKRLIFLSAYIAEQREVHMQKAVC